MRSNLGGRESGDDTPFSHQVTLKNLRYEERQRERNNNQIDSGFISQ